MIVIKYKNNQEIQRAPPACAPAAADKQQPNGEDDTIESTSPTSHFFSNCRARQGALSSSP